MYRELTAKSPTPHAHFPHVVHLRSCASWFGCCYTRACSMLSPGRSPGRGGSGVRLDGVAACPCAPSAPCSVHAFPSSGPGRGGGRGRRARTPRRRAEAASRGLWRPVTGVVCRLSLLLYRTGTRKPGAPRTRIIFNACRRSRDRTIECLQISRLHATGDKPFKRNTRHETLHARTVPEPVYVSADSANSRAAHDSTDRVLA